MSWVGCARHGYGDDLLYDSLLFNMKHIAGKIPAAVNGVNMTVVQTVITDLDHTKKESGDKSFRE